MKTIAVIVTYNRKELLKECLNAILEQTVAADRMIVIDNNSNDGTDQYFVKQGIFYNERILYKKLDRNLGGAGGFYEGLKLANSMQPDWIWIMDDDTIPEKSALEEMYKALKHVERNTSFIASSVYGINGEATNVPSISKREALDGYCGWYMKLDQGLVEIQDATFVSLLIRNDAVCKVGLPQKDYFIWGDDTEYTLRLTKYYGPAYLCGRSKVLHKRVNNKKLSIIHEENADRLKMFYFYVRNNLINQRAYFGIKSLVKRIILLEIDTLRILFKNDCQYRMKKAVIIQKGIFAYCFRKYDYKSFQTRLPIHGQ